MSDKLREALRRIVGIRGICFEGRPLCHAIDQFDLIHNLAVKALADSATAVLDNTPRLQSPQLPDSITVDAPPEPTDEMVEAYAVFRQRLRMALWRDDFWPNNPGVEDDEIVEAVGRLIDERAALAVQQKGEG